MKKLRVKEAPYKEKAKTLKAIGELVYNYKNNNYVSHTLIGCPLCLVHFDKIANSCGSCPNRVFDISNNDFNTNPCYTRKYSYVKLNYLSSDNNKTLYKFWKEVRGFLRLRPAAAVVGLSTGTIEGILEIAKKYK